MITIKDGIRLYIGLLIGAILVIVGSFVGCGILMGILSEVQ